MKRILLLVLLLCGCSGVAAQRVSPRGHDLYGAVRDDKGRPVAGVVVSDGFTCCETDRRGVYRLDRNPAAAFVFYSVPAEYAVNVRAGYPSFYKPLAADAERYDFTLEPLPEGVEREFRLFCMADPQCQTERHIERFRSETVPDVMRASRERDVPSYGVTLGDVAYSSDKVNAEWVMERMRRAMDRRLIGMPVFQTMGNHDNTFVPVEAEAGSSTINMKYRRAFESVFGPADYSWNRGEAHFVSMKNIDYKSGERSSEYALGFSDEQVEWLRRDLSFVPRDKMVVLCVHIPICASKDENALKVVEMLGEFAEAHIMAGHTHYNRNHIQDRKSVV